MAVICCPFPGSGEAEWLAGVPGGEDVDGFEVAPIGGGEVADVGDGGEAVGEDAGGCRVVLRMPREGVGEVGAGDVGDPEVETAVPGAEGPDPQAHASAGRLLRGVRGIQIRNRPQPLHRNCRWVRFIRAAQVCHAMYPAGEGVWSSHFG